MKPGQEKIIRMSKKIMIVLRLGFIVSNVIAILSLIAIGILVFSGEDTKSSFLAAFNVTANNGTTISIEARSLLIMFVYMLIDTLLISLAIFLVYAVFNGIMKGLTPFLPENTARIKKNCTHRSYFEYRRKLLRCVSRLLYHWRINMAD